MLYDLADERAREDAFQLSARLGVRERIDVDALAGRRGCPPAGPGQRSATWPQPAGSASTCTTAPGSTATSLSPRHPHRATCRGCATRWPWWTPVRSRRRGRLGRGAGDDDRMVGVDPAAATRAAARGGPSTAGAAARASTCSRCTCSAAAAAEPPRAPFPPVTRASGGGWGPSRAEWPSLPPLAGEPAGRARSRRARSAWSAAGAPAQEGDHADQGDEHGGASATRPACHHPSSSAAGLADRRPTPGHPTRSRRGSTAPPRLRESAPGRPPSPRPRCRRAASRRRRPPTPPAAGAAAGPTPTW